MRMFAGPNGSGKSSLKNVLDPDLQGFYINPDEIERGLRECRRVDFRDFGLDGVAEAAVSFLKSSFFLRKASRHWESLAPSGDCLLLGDLEVDSYLASVLSDFIRGELLKRKLTFTFETVMSHHGKVDLLEHARRSGYRTYLYYVATEDPLINISRVKNRVRLGGHPVPQDKIVARYHRSLGLLPNAIRRTSRAYIFDNSGEGTEHTWLAEITEGTELEMKTDRIPIWFKRSVLDII